MSEKIIQPPLIRYNLKDRGRTHRGVERDFNIPAIVEAINAPFTQELVKTRGMLGYLGHWVRIRFGLEPPEGGMYKGKAFAVEPAIVTTFLKAYPNGDIEHQTEFLDTHSGRIASRMYSNTIGGFSSVIDENKMQDPNKPRFYGFDWVNDPNYSTNRGYEVAMDSVSSGEMTLDDVLAAELHDQTQAMTMLIEASEYREKLALDSAVALRDENDQLLELLSEYNAATQEPIVIGGGATAERMLRDKATFDSTLHLPKFKEKDSETKKADQKIDLEYQSILNRYNT